MAADILGNIFLILALISILCGVVFSIMIATFVSKHGTKINYFLFRIFVIKYANQYRKITEEENGKVGPLFYSFIGSFVLALLFAIVGLILKRSM